MKKKKINTERHSFADIRLICNIGIGFYRQDYSPEHTGLKGYQWVILLPFCKIDYTSFIIVDLKHNIAKSVESL